MAIEMIDGLPAPKYKGEYRKLGALPPAPQDKAKFRAFRNHFQRLPRSRWVKRDFRSYGAKTENQGKKGSCSCQSAVKAFDVLRRASGMKPADLSGTFGYAQINGGRDQGASVSANMEVLMRMGACLRTQVGDDQIYKQQIPREAYQTALDYRLQEAFLLRTFDDFGTALTIGHTAAIGIAIGENFANLDRRGIAPLPNITVGGHAMAVVGLDVIDGDWVLLLQNSWDEDFGFDGGFCYITESHTRAMLDGFALVLALESGKPGLDDVPPPVPPMKASRKSSFVVVDKPVEKEPEQPAATTKVVDKDPPSPPAISIPWAPHVVSVPGMTKEFAESIGGREVGPQMTSADDSLDRQVNTEAPVNAPKPASIPLATLPVPPRPLPAPAVHKPTRKPQRPATPAVPSIEQALGGKKPTEVPAATPPPTPLTITAEAREMASLLLSATAAERDAELASLKQKDPTAHALVLAALEETRK